MCSIGQSLTLGGMNFEAVRQHLRPLSPEKLEAFVRKHGRGVERSVELADVFSEEELEQLRQQLGQPERGG